MSTPNAQGYYQVDNGMGGMDWYGADGNRAYGYNPNQTAVPSVAPTQTYDTQPANLAEALQRQAGGADYMQQQWNNWTPDKWQTGLSPEMLDGVVNKGWLTAPNTDLSSNKGISVFSRNPNTGEIAFNPQGHGAGEDYYVYDGNTGKYLRTEKGAKVQSYASGVLSVLGAAAGMGAAFGGLGAGGYASGGFLGGGGGAAPAAAGVTGLPSGSLADMFYGGGADLVPGASGVAGSTLGGGGSFLGSGLGSTSVGGLASAAGSAGGSSLLSQLGSKLGSSTLSSILKGMGGGGGDSNSNGGINLSDIASLFGGGLDYYNQSKAADTMRQWLDTNQAKMEGYMNPDSPEYKALWEQMSRNDAAAGRNSQYGPRTSDFAAKVAQAKAQNTLNFTTGNSRAYSNALNQAASAPAGLSAALQRMAQGGSGGGINLSSILNSLKGTSILNSDGSFSDQDILNQIYNNGGAPIDYGAGMSDPTEQDVLDEIARWGY